MIEPVLLALITADKVIVEAGNNKKTIIGTFTFFNSPQFPITFPPWAIYAAVTNIEGEHNFSFNINNNENGQTVFSVSGKMGVLNAKVISEITVPVFNLTFPTPGDYSLTINIDAKQIGYRLISINRIPESGPNV